MPKSHYKNDEIMDLDARMAENERKLAEINERFGSQKGRKIFGGFTVRI